MRPPDPQLPSVITFATALGAGMTRQQVRRRVDSGRWRRLHRGVYCRTAEWEAADSRARHLVCAAAAQLISPPAWRLSHATAAVCFGLPMPFRPPPVWQTRPRGGPTRYLDGRRLLVAPVPAEHGARLEIGRVTSLARTVADCLRHLSTEDAVAIGDAALRASPTLRPVVAEVLAHCACWPYAERGQSRLLLLDGRRESPLESLSAVEMHRGGVPAPEAQALLYDDRGLVGRSDFWWPDRAVVGEVDGLVKYDVVASLDGARAALLAEKAREQRLWRMGAHVVRWGLKDLRSPGFAAWLNRELALSDPGRFHGRVVLTPRV